MIILCYIILWLPGCDAWLGREPWSPAGRCRRAYRRGWARIRRWNRVADLTARASVSLRGPSSERAARGERRARQPTCPPEIYARMKAHDPISYMSYCYSCVAFFMLTVFTISFRPEHRGLRGRSRPGCGAPCHGRCRGGALPFGGDDSNDTDNHNSNKPTHNTNNGNDHAIDDDHSNDRWCYS